MSIVANFLFSIVVGLFSAFVALKQWQWFAHKLSHGSITYSPSFVECYVFMMLLGFILVRPTLRLKTEDKYTSDSGSELSKLIFAYDLIFLVTSYIIHVFIY
jgi:hypothetical protein